MAAPKIKPSLLTKLYVEGTKKSDTLHDKKVVESLRERLNDKIMKDPRLAKKAALIISNWINQKK